MKQNLLFLLAFSSAAAFAQPTSYSTNNGHSHNDYTQSVPLQAAYYAQFGSIEVDVYLENDEILVAHSAKDVAKNLTLEELYLKPIQKLVETNNGYIYSDTSNKLILMLDIKTEAVATLTKALEILQKYPVLLQAKNLKILISGNKPDPTTYAYYPKYVWFDGLLRNKYNAEALSRILVLSDNFLEYTKFRGNNGTVPEKDFLSLQKPIDKAHALGKLVRFWNTPDYNDTWETLTRLGVDFINTDSIKSLAAFLKQKKLSGGK
jgi:glycerophosphoryl diester phosphodiesterase